MGKTAVHIISFGLVFLLMTGCQQGIFISQQKEYPPLPEEEGFVVFLKDDTTDLTGGEIVGEIILKRGMSAGCAYDLVVDFAKNKAKGMGANALKIYETRPPDIWIDPCYKIKAKAYRLNNLSEYEQEISWHPKRKLTIGDFKGSKEDRPFLAVTSSQIRLRWVQYPTEKYATCIAEAWFSCQNSYFTEHTDSVETLAHEQLHFDITELHARKLVKRIADEIKDLADLQVKGQKLLDETYSSMGVMQDKYDSEVYPDPAKQAIWSQKIRDELEAMKMYEIKQVKIKIKA